MGKLFYAALIASFLLLFSLLANSLGAAYEGKFFPVVTKFEIIKVENNGEGRSFVWVKFEKIRSCTYLGMTWERKTIPGFLRIFVDTNPLEGVPTTRPLGEAVAGPWLVDVPPEKIFDDSRITLLHSCNPLYYTQTSVYP